MDTPKDKRRKLHEQLVQRELYSKSFEDFENQFSTQEKWERLYDNLFERDLYSKGIEDFENQFFADLLEPKEPIQEQPTQESTTQPVQQPAPQPTQQPAPQPAEEPAEEPKEKKSFITRAGEAIRYALGDKGELADRYGVGAKYGNENIRQNFRRNLAEEIGPGYYELTEEKINEWIEEAAQDKSGTAFGSGVESLISSLTQAAERIVNQPTYYDPRISPGGGYIPLTPKQEEQLKADQQRAIEMTGQRQDLMESGFFTKMTEQALKRQIISQQKWKNALEAQGLDPETTMTEAFNEKGLVGGLKYIGSLIAQQAPQVVGAIGVGALTKNPTLVAGVMGSSAAGGDMISTIMEKRALDDKDVIAAWAKGAVEGGAEALLSPAFTLGVKGLKQVGGRIVGEIMREGGAKTVKSILREMLKSGVGEGSEEVAVELIGNLIDSIKESEPDWNVEDFIKANAEAFDANQLLETFVAGAGTGAPMGAFAEITRSPELTIDDKIKGALDGLDDTGAGRAVSDRLAELRDVPEDQRDDEWKKEVEQNIEIAANLAGRSSTGKVTEDNLERDEEVDVVLELIGDEVIDDPGAWVANYIEQLDGKQKEIAIQKQERLEDAIEANNKRLSEPAATPGQPGTPTPSVDNDIKSVLDLIGDEVVDDPETWVIEYLDQLDGQYKDLMLDKQDLIEEAIRANNERIQNASSQQAPGTQKTQAPQAPQEAETEGEAGEQAVVDPEEEARRQQEEEANRLRRIKGLQERKAAIEQELEGVPANEKKSRRKILEIINKELEDLDVIEEETVTPEKDPLTKEERDLFDRIERIEGLIAENPEGNNASREKRVEVFRKQLAEKAKALYALKRKLEADLEGEPENRLLGKRKQLEITNKQLAEYEKAGIQESMLEGVRDGGIQEEGQQEGAELRAETKQEEETVTPKEGVIGDIEKTFGVRVTELEPGVVMVEDAGKGKPGAFEASKNALVNSGYTIEGEEGRQPTVEGDYTPPDRTAGAIDSDVKIVMDLVGDEYINDPDTWVDDYTSGLTGAYKDAVAGKRDAIKAEIEKNNQRLEAAPKQEEVAEVPEIETNAPAIGKTGEMDVDEIEVDPDRFQFKDVEDKDRGVSRKLETSTWNPELAGTISVWVDPADSKTYVINGHHRLDLAKRSGVEKVNVLRIEAKDASEARKKGALQNMTEGMGTSIDAAKVFRESTDPEGDIMDYGLSMREKLAQEGLALSKLAQPLFDLVAKGRLPKNVGVIIGKYIDSESLQTEFYNSIKGKGYTQGQLEVMAQDISSAETTVVETTDLFGTTKEEKANFAARAKFVSNVRRAMSRQKNLLGKAAKGKEFLEEYGNQIDEAMSAGASKEAAQALAIFDRYRNIYPQINQIINDAFKRIQDGESERKITTEVTRELTKLIPQLVAGESKVKKQVTKTTEKSPGSFMFEPDNLDAIMDLANELDPKGKTDIREIPRIAQAFKQFFNKPVIIHRSHKDAVEWLNNLAPGLGDKALGGSGWKSAAFYMGTSIHVIADNAGKTSSKHEFLHSMIGTILSNEADTFQALFDDMLMMPEFQASGLYDQVMELYADESEATKQEEMVVEFMAQIAAGTIKLSEPSKNKIIALIRTLMQSMGFTMNEVGSDFREFARNVSDAMMDGREIKNAYKNKDKGSKPIKESRFLNSDAFKAWKGDAKMLSDVANATTGRAMVARVFHGTTHDFNVFQGGAYGTVQGHLGAVNYLTSSSSDARDNYGGKGPDLTQRIAALSDSVSEIINDEYDLDDVDDFQNMLDEYGLEAPFGTSLDDISMMVAEKQLYGGKDKVLDLVVKLNNPVVIESVKSRPEYWTPVSKDMYADFMEDAAAEIAEENGIPLEEAMEDMEWDVRARAMENAGVVNPLIDALQSSLNEFTIDGDNVNVYEILEDFIYEDEINLSELEGELREKLSEEFITSEEGEFVSTQVLAMTFRNLGFDGIILKNVERRFPGMNITPGTAHVHVFDEYNNQIKLADGTNTTFNSDTPDIRFQRTSPKKKLKRKHLHQPFHIVVKSLRGQSFDPKKAAQMVDGAPKSISRAIKDYSKTGNKKQAYKALRAINKFYKDTHPEVRKKEFTVLNNAVDKILDLLEGKGSMKDVRKAMKKIDLKKLDKQRFKDKMKRYRSGKFSEKSEKQQLYHFIEEVNEYFEDPVRSEATDVAVQASVIAPKIKFSRTPVDQRIDNFVKSKDGIRSDADIAITLMNVFNLDQAQAIAAIERSLRRNYIPQTNNTRTVRRSIYRRVLTPFKSTWEFLKDKKLPIGRKDMTFGEFGTYMDVMYADKFAGIRKLEEQIKKNLQAALPDSMTASAKLDQATSKAAFYRNQLITKLFGAQSGDYVGYKMYGKNSLVAQMMDDGVTWDMINRFSFFRHVPEFLARKQELAQKQIDYIQRQIDDIQDKLNRGVGNPIVLNNKLNGSNGLINYLNELQDRFPTHIGKDTNGTEIDADYAEQQVADMMRENPEVMRWTEEIRNMLLDERHGILEEHKLISEERLEALRSGTSVNSSVEFEYYVPMKVDEHLLDDKSEEFESAVHTINNLGIHNLEGFGGTEYGFLERHSPLTQLLADVLATKEIAEHNDAMRSLANLLTKYKSSDFEVRRSKMKASVNEWGQVEFKDQLIKAEPDDADARNGVSFVADNGRRAVIIPKTRTAAESNIFLAFKRADPSMNKHLNLAKRIISPIMNLYRSGVTSMSIVFGFNQLAPDLIDAVANMNVDMGADSKKGFVQKKKLQAKFVANWAKSMKFLASPYNYKSGLDMDLTNTDPNTMTMREFWLEAQLNGMPLSWKKINYSFEDGYKELDKIASESDKLPVKATMKNLAKGYVNTISNLNDAMENVNRLTAYITARKEGLSPQRAAQMGKEITINFERKGVKDDMMRLMYLFWGAAVNGAKRSGKTMKALGRKGAGAVIMGAVINRMLMYAFMDEDEREGFIQSEYNNRNRVIIPIPGTGKHINVKSPYSFMRIYYAMGKGIVDVAYNQRTLADVVTDMLDGFMTAFSPIAGNASFTNFAPTLAQPLVQVLANSDYKGDPIISKAQELFRYRNIDKYKQSTEDREGTDELFVQLAERIYELTGFDWSPAYMEYLFDGYIYKPALRETITPIDNIPNMFGGHKISDSVAEALGFDMTNREFDFWGGDANNVIPPLKAFYRPNDVELQSLWNFYSFTDRPLWKGLTDEQFMYIASAYETILKNELADPRAVESVISKLKDKYPDKKWIKVDMIKDMYK